MSHRSIPAALEPAIVQLIAERRSTREIAAWLWSKHEINASHMAVHRLVERLRYQSVERDLEAELDLEALDFPTQLRTLQALGEQFAELGDLALRGDPERGVKPNVRLAGLFFAKQLRAVEKWHAIMEKRERARKPKAAPAAKPSISPQPPQDAERQPESPAAAELAAEPMSPEAEAMYLAQARENGEMMKAIMARMREMTAAAVL